MLTLYSQTVLPRIIPIHDNQDLMDKPPINQNKGKRKTQESEQEDEDIKKRKLNRNNGKISEEDTSIYEEALETSIKTPQKISVQLEMDNDELYRKITEKSEADKKELKDVIQHTVKISEEKITKEFKNDIRESETKITTRVDTVQKDISEMKERQHKQEENVNKLAEHQNEIIKRLEYLEKGEKTKNHKNNGKLTSWQERLKEQVDMTRKKIAIFGIPDDEDSIFIRNIANELKLTQDIKEEMKNSIITFIQDKRPTKGPKPPNSRLFHMTTTGYNSRQAILMATKNKPRGLRFDHVIPHPFKIGHNKQKPVVWQLRNGMGLSVQHEIHGYTSIIYINEKDSKTDRRRFSEFVPVDKQAKPKLSPESMETNTEDNDDDKPTIAYNENKQICEELSAIIFWTAITDIQQDEQKMIKLETILNVEDYAKISTDTVHAKHLTRLVFNSKEDAIEIYNKYNKEIKATKWDWSIFDNTKFNMI